MAFTYKLLPSGGDSHQSTPYWFAAFVRFQMRDTFTRKNLGTSANASRSGVASNLVSAAALDELDLDVFLVEHDIVNWTVSSAKEQHVSNLSLTLANADTDYARELASGDWVGFWVFDDYSDYVRVRDAVANRQRANGFRDGLKFIGRVEGARKNKQRNPATGMLSLQYSVTALGFSEFDSILYYNPMLAAKYASDVSLWMMDFGKGINDLLRGIGTGLIQSQGIIPKLTRICLGVGPGESSLGLQPDQNNSDYIDPNSLRISENRAYRIPQTIARWLLDPNLFQTKKPVGVTYADLLLMYVGIQKYSTLGFSTLFNNVDPAPSIEGFIPDHKGLDNGVYEMHEPLSGDYRVTVTPFDAKPVWSILRTYVNEPVDELYTCLRVDPKGYVMPSLIARQNPMSTKWYAINSGYTVTAFTELPRWEISSTNVLSLDVGRSNVPRINYVHFQGQDMTGGQIAANMAINYARNPPIIDPDDISRSGLRMITRVLSANVFQGNNDDSPGGKWQRIMADILMGSHLKYSGTLVCKGIQEPIPEGDNLVVDGVIYHIERVTHAGSVSMLGMKDFITTLQLSNGISIENDTSTTEEIIYPDMSTQGVEDDRSGTVALE